MIIFTYLKDKENQFDNTDVEMTYDGGDELGSIVIKFKDFLKSIGYSEKLVNDFIEYEE
jgi:hypothetical protein